VVGDHGPRPQSQRTDEASGAFRGSFAIGLADEAQASAAVLGYNFPNSEWYTDAYHLLVDHGFGGVPPKPVQVAKVTTSASPPPSAPPPAHPNAAVPALPPPEANVTPENVAATEPAPGSAGPQASAGATQLAPETSVAAATSAPATPAPTTTANASSPTPPATTTASAQPKPTNTDPYQTHRYQGYGGDEDLQDSWVRRLFRNLF